MNESKVEQYLHNEVLKLGGTSYKWVSPQRNGVPDRIVILPGGVVWFIEVRTLKSIARPEQKREIERLKSLGVKVGWVQGKDGVDNWIKQCT